MMLRRIRIYLVFTLFILSTAIYSQISSLRIEPPFWWAGMKDPSLQLLVYGTGVAEANVIVGKPGITLVQVRRADHPDYLFIDLEIQADALPGKYALVFEYQREILATVDYELRARAEGSAERVGFGREDVIYLIMPDRFSDGDTTNNNMDGMLERSDPSNPDGRHGGDLEGIRQKIGYLADLGVTAIWLNPVLENNMPAYSYHGYAITDFYRVDPRLGTNESYRELVKESHEKGLKVIMDMVFNHCGSNHWWMKDMPMGNWIHQFPGFTRSNYRAETVKDPYASDYDQTRMMTGWFDRTMPDLDQRNAILANYLIQNSLWWIEYAGLDGIRMDTYPYSYKDFMAKWMERVLLEYPGFSVVGETWQQKEVHTAYWQDESPISGDYRSHLDYVTDFPMHYALRDAFMQEEGWTTGLNRLYYVLAQDFIYADPFNNVIFPDNHDLDRFYTSVGEDFNKFKMAMAILLTTRGIPMIYYGTELLMTGEEHKGHGFIREDFPLGRWRSAAGGQQSAVGHLDSRQLMAKEYLQSLLNWRKNADVIHYGKLKQFIPENGIYVYFRYTAEDAVMVVINKNQGPEELSPGRFQEVLKDYSSGRDVVSGEVFKLDSKMNIPAETALILELKAEGK